MNQKRITLHDILKHKGQEPLVCLTAYTAPFAHILDQHCDILLVGDSMGMVLYGMESTLGVTTEMMIAHGKAVVNASSRSFVVVDMPFGSYQASPTQAFEAAARVMAETGCQAVKLEGGIEMADTVNFLVERGIPVMGHVGLMPQRVAAYGGYRYQGKTKETAKQILADAETIADAGAFAVVVEGVPAKLAETITKKLPVPVIGIGASVACDGQVLVTEDMAGLFTEFKPKFVRHYAQLAETLGTAAASYAQDVRSRAFPGDDEQV